MGMPITDRIPTLDRFADVDQRQSVEKALRYMDLEPGQPLLGHPIDVVFIGSCTNSRISDLRLAAGLLNGRKVADGIRMLVVPGSQSIKRQAEAEGLHEIFLSAGAEWRESGCSMCLAMNGDELEPGQYGVSTSNRNYEGRQGRGGRTFLASPLTRGCLSRNGRDRRRPPHDLGPNPMNEFHTLTSHVVPLDQKDVDTDQIIPARFLTTISKEGLGGAPVRRLAEAS